MRIKTIKSLVTLQELSLLIILYLYSIRYCMSNLWIGVPLLVITLGSTYIHFKSKGGSKAYFLFAYKNKSRVLHLFMIILEIGLACALWVSQGITLLSFSVSFVFIWDILLRSILIARK